jgi:soluble lytic murein transglycosylase-like protein
LSLHFLLDSGCPFLVPWNLWTRLLGEAYICKVPELVATNRDKSITRGMTMISWCTCILLVCALLCGCGRGKQAVKPVTAGPPELAQEEVREVQQESLAEQLSAKRLEELYAKGGIRGQDPALETELKKWDQALKTDVPVATNKEVKAYLVYFTTDRKQTMRNYLSRSTRYLPMIREIFQEHGLPEDLAYLAMIESGFNPCAYSPAHASGMWQFIAGTGRRYGLAIDNYVDERRDPIKSTHAAAKYLLDLYKQFGSWYLAAASYNCGEGRVKREIDASNHKNFWDLSDNRCLPTETKNYVPQMIAATIIAKNPEKFGFAKVPYLPSLQYDTVKVNEPTSLRAVSVAVNVPPEEIVQLNPELRRGTTPPDLYVLKIPKNSKDLFNRNIQIARIEVPTQVSAPVETASNSYWRNYPRREHSTPVSRDEGDDSREYTKKEAAPVKESNSRRGAPSARTPVKTAPQQAKAAPAKSYNTAHAHKGKTEPAKSKETSVQVASMLPGGKCPPRTAKGSTPPGKDKANKPQGESSVKKVNQKPVKKKVGDQSSCNPQKAKTAQSQGSRARVAGTPPKADTRKKRPVQTAAKTRPSSS